MSALNLVTGFVATQMTWEQSSKSSFKKSRTLSFRGIGFNLPSAGVSVFIKEQMSHCGVLACVPYDEDDKLGVRRKQTYGQVSSIVSFLSKKTSFCTCFS